MLTELKRQVLEANLALARHDLVTLTWGNVSGIDRRKGLVVIKPSGVPYDTLGPDDMVVVDLDGRAAEGRHRPSSDLPTHLALYLAWPDIGGIAHAHSTHATMFAQACRPIPCLGTTHADYFHGPVPVTRSLTDREVAGDYESNTGDVIVERFAGTNPLHLPGVLVANHGPFTWGRNAGEAVQHAVVLEQVACLAMGTLRINAAAAPIAPYLLDKHFARKHGPDAYYGQPAAKP